MSAQPAITLTEAMESPALFEPWFRGPSWDGWRVVLKAAYALPMTESEVAFFRTVAHRDPPKRRVSEAWFICGRGAGKDSVASAIVAHAAALFDGEGKLRPGERAMVSCVACDRDQARIVLGYAKSYFDDIALLRSMVTRETATGFELSNRVDISVATNSHRSIRGRSLLAVVFDECAFWRDENFASPDEEVYRAVGPGLARAPGSILIGISSPYRRSGLLYRKYAKHFGKNDDDVLVIQAASTLLNPTLDRSIVDRALEDDPAAARAEWLAEFRTDIESFISREAVETCVIAGRHELPPASKANYFAFVDPSGGSVDEFTLAIAHRDDKTVIVDAVRAVKPPLSPDDVAKDFCEVIKSYGLRSVTGDNYACEWPKERFRVHGVRYEKSPKPKSDLYKEMLPLINGHRVELLDNQKLVSQLCALERKVSAGGRDTINHPDKYHDDVINAVAGAIVLAGGARVGPMKITDAVLAKSLQRPGPSVASMPSRFPSGWLR